jgi:chromosome partitioning protein
MSSIAVYSMKGGVGKTTLAVNLAWASAALSSRRTLLWDIDAQAAASYILAPKHKAKRVVRDVLLKDVDPAELIIPTAIAQLDLLPADESLRGADALFAELDRKNRIRRLSEALDQRYDRIILDCPPGLGMTSEQIIRAADLVILPLVPSTLSRRAYAEVRDHLDRHHKGQTTNCAGV